MPGEDKFINPMSVRNLKTAMAIPRVSVGRMMGHRGSLRVRKGQGSGMIRLVWNVSPLNGGNSDQENEIERSLRPSIKDYQGSNCGCSQGRSGGNCCIRVSCVPSLVCHVN